MAQIDDRIAGVLLALASAGLVASLFLGWGWYRSSHAPVELARLTAAERQRLVEEMTSVSPGDFATAWFEPRIGYTLKRKQRIEAWNDVFETNELGYRSVPAAKGRRVYRVLFVGDSWTFGMGVREEETFAERFEQLANTHAGLDRRVEAWILALPGYNTFAETNALWFFYERLRPDAVVFSPTSNDNHSLSAVLPNGSLAQAGVLHDLFGDPHPTVYRVPVDSYRYRDRWRAAFALLRETEERLEGLGVPLLLHFTGSWRIPLIHHLVAEAGLESPYVVAPPEYTSMRWRNPRPIGHPNKAAHEIYGRMIYQAMAQILDWPPLAGDEPGIDVPLHQARPDRQRWAAAAGELLAQLTREEIPEGFVVPTAAPQCLGALDPKTGVLGRAGTVLIRRRAGAARLWIEVARLADAPSLYPLELTVTVPSAAGGSSTVVPIAADGPERQRFTVEMPADVRPGAALDVVFEPSRVSADRERLAPRSIRVVAIGQEEA